MMQSLTKQLDAFLAGFLERTDRGTAAVIRRAEHQLEQSGIVGHALKVGDIAPEFVLPDQTGKLVSLRAALESGPVVLTFFRGGWCPFCSLALRALMGIVPELRQRGGELMAISPQSSAHTTATAERNGLSFPVLSDHDNAVSAKFGLVWTLDPEHRAIYERLGHPLPRINGTNNWDLPIPASYVIGQDSRITFAHVDPRVNRRLEPAAALAAVRELHAEHAT
jgi:peroxiredoxin